MAIDNRALGAYHLADNPDLYEVQRSNNFVFVVTNLGDLIRPSTSVVTESSYIKNVQEVIRISCKGAPVPHFKQNTLEIRRGNSVMKMAGLAEYSDGDITLDDFIGADTLSALMAWQRLSYDPVAEKIGKMSEYKKDCELIEYAPDGVTMVRYWILKGCFITGLSERAFDSDDGAKREITASITYDKAFMYLPDDTI